MPHNEVVGAEPGETNSVSRVEGEPNPANSLRSLAILLATGWLVTNLALSIADLPLRYLLKDRLHLSAAAVAGFFALGNFTNYIKPLA